MGFGQAIRGIHRFPELQQACHILQCLTEAPPLLSPAAQVQLGLGRGACSRSLAARAPHPPSSTSPERGQRVTPVPELTAAADP